MSEMDRWFGAKFNRPFTYYCSTFAGQFSRPSDGDVGHHYNGGYHAYGRPGGLRGTGKQSVFHPGPRVPVGSL